MLLLHRILQLIKECVQHLKRGSRCRRMMERCEGTKIDRLEGHFRAGRLSFRQVMEALTTVYLQMMMVDGGQHFDALPRDVSYLKA